MKGDLPQSLVALVLTSLYTEYNSPIQENEDLLMARLPSQNIVNWINISSVGYFNTIHISHLSFFFCFGTSS